MDYGEPNSIGSLYGWYEAPVEFGSPESAYWTNGWPWFLLVTTNKTKNLWDTKELIHLCVWCVCHLYFSWSSIFLAILLISPPLSPPNGALCCGTSHLSLCIITARHGNNTMSQIRCRWSNLYLFTSWITINIFVLNNMWMWQFSLHKSVTNFLHK